MSTTTPVQAKERWCPFVRTESSNRINNSLTDGVINTPDLYHCVADECMAWRTIPLGHLKPGAAKTLEGHGYCGLAGRPDLEDIY
jgi:hypothetical protein